MACVHQLQGKTRSPQIQVLHHSFSFSPPFPSAPHLLPEELWLPPLLGLRLHLRALLGVET